MAPDKQMQLFNKAQAQIREHVLKEQSKNGGQETCHIGLVQLGDLGDYNHLPGSRACFERCRQWLDQFELPVGLITGNHDLGVCTMARTQRVEMHLTMFVTHLNPFQHKNVPSPTYDLFPLYVLEGPEFETDAENLQAWSEVSR